MSNKEKRATDRDKLLFLLITLNGKENVQTKGMSVYCNKKRFIFDKETEELKQIVEF